ncbi:titin-like [Sinocyclocheilus grahami]|uniref:titin-like n=1 Tax=Sinocyclocheilus grahami TaxID=75366 RepID=UPI0007ACB529|nr:PREDICTED: titin-like [Sinocyclocheilus grahami]
MLQCRVNFLDDTCFVWELEVPEQCPLYVSRYTPEEDQREEEKREAERKIQQELVTPEKTKTQTREEVIQSRVKTEEVQKGQEEQVTVDYRRLQPFVLEQRAAEPQIDKEDDWFVVLDGSPKRSVPSVELYEETREEVIQGRVRTEQIKQQEQVTMDYGRPQTVILEQKTTQPQRDVEDDWFIIFDVSPKESEPLAYPQLQAPTVELYEETKEEVIQSRVRTEEQVIEVMTVSIKEQIIAPEKKRTSIIQTMFPVVPRDFDDDWFQLFDEHKHEQKSFPSEIRVGSVTPLEAEEKRAVERRRKEEEQMTVVYRRPEPVILEQKAAEPQRDVEDDWFIIFDVSPKESVPSFPLLRGPAVELYEETGEEVIQSRVRTEEQVIEVMTVSAKEQIIVPEKKRTSIIQTPQFPVVPGDFDDRRQIKIEERTKTPSVPEKKPVQLQTEAEDGWFTFMGISPKDYIPTPVIYPVAPPKPRPQIPADQPLTSTPTTQPVSITKTNLYKNQERTKDLWNITPETEVAAFHFCPDIYVNYKDQHYKHNDT